MKRLLLAAVLLLFTGCAGQPPATDKINVVASFYPIEFLVRQIATDHVNLQTLVPRGSEPHDYELTPRDIGTIESSRLLIANGLVEPWFANEEQNLKGSRVSVLNLSAEMKLLTSVDAEESGKDPHLWLDPALMSQMADEVSAALVQADPHNATVYQANALELKQQLAELDQAYQSGLGNCTQKNIVTSHAAFAYLADRYGLTQVAISGLSPDAEPSAQKIKQIVDFARSNNVTVIFFESLVNPALADTIATELGAKTMVLNPIEGLTADQQAAGEDYLSLMKENLQNLKTALACH